MIIMVCCVMGRMNETIKAIAKRKIMPILFLFIGMQTWKRYIKEIKAIIIRVVDWNWMSVNIALVEVANIPTRVIAITARNRENDPGKDFSITLSINWPCILSSFFSRASKKEGTPVVIPPRSVWWDSM